MTSSVGKAQSPLQPTALAVCLGTALSLGAFAPAAAQQAVPLSTFGTFAPTAHEQAPWVRSNGRKAQAFADLRASPPLPRAASTVVVQNCNDSGVGSLRAAMLAAVDTDTIDLTQLSCSTITLTNGGIATSANNIHLIGPGAGALTLDGNMNSSVLYHNGTGTLGVFGITFKNGKYTGDSLPTGGCIYSTGSVALYSSVVSGCAVATASTDHYAKGGGIYAAGNVTLVNSTVSNNICGSSVSIAQGGGVYAVGAVAVAYSTIADNTATGHAHGLNPFASACGGLVNSGNVLIAGSTISGNRAFIGAGLCLQGATATAPLTLKESTISGNVASGQVGGVMLSKAAVVQSSTIAFNKEANSYSSAGVYVKTTANIQSSIIVANLSGTSNFDVGGASSGTTITAAKVMIGQWASVAFPPGATIHGTASDLKPLQDNGGLTRTHAIAAGSQAIDHGNNVGNFGVDQRGPGFPRVVGTGADIGAFETNSDIIFANGFN